MEKHTAFLEGAIGIEKTPICKEDDLNKERGLCKQWGLPGVGD